MDRHTGHTNRAVTPITGVVLIVGITVSLLLLVAPLMFSVSNNATDETPSPEFAFFYDENAEPDTEDTFGETRGGADGLVTIRVENADEIEAENVRIEGAASGTALVEDTSSDEYEAGDSILSGDEITVWAKRTETIRVIWTSEDEKESVILEEYSLPATRDVPSYAPDPDEDCDWVEDQLAVSTDLTVDGIVVECDLDQYSIDNVDIINGGTVLGTVQANSDVTIDDGSTFGGFVEAESGKVDVQGGSDLNGDVKAGNGLDLDQQSVIDGDVEIEGDVNLWDGSEIQGDLIVDGNNVVIDTSTVAGTVTANNDTNVDLIEGYVTGNVDATGNVGLDQVSTVSGDVFLNETSDSLTCNDGDSSTIAGVGCEEYRAATFLVTIENTNDPVEHGNTLEVTATIENDGYETATKTVTLEIDGYQNDSKSISLDGKQNTTTTFEWSTGSVDNQTYNATVDSPDDWTSTAVDVVADAPPKFQDLNLTLDSVTGSGDLKSVEFDYNLTESGNLTFELEKDGTVQDSATRSSSGELWVWDHADTPLAVFIRVDIGTGSCYEIRVPTNANQGATYDMLEGGTSC